jgi:hypothetical protein
VIYDGDSGHVLSVCPEEMEMTGSSPNPSSRRTGDSRSAMQAVCDGAVVKTLRAEGVGGASRLAVLCMSSYVSP